MSEFENHAITLMLLTLLLMVLTFCVVMVMAIRSWRRRLHLMPVRRHSRRRTIWPDSTVFRNALGSRPLCWVAVRTRNPFAVQLALGLGNPQPCFWNDGLGQIEDQRWFISPPIDGWVLVMGAGLPEPGDDVDECFHFLRQMSLELGEVQFFQANRVVMDHAWVMMNGGVVVRAYAWSGRTLWNQGPLTREERLLGMACHDCLEGGEPDGFGVPEHIALNVEKVSRLASGWSLDPARVDANILNRQPGISGEPFQTGQD